MSRPEDDPELEKLVDPIDALVSNFSPSPVPIAPDGSAHPVVGEPMKIPDATPENFICLRGPCVHYMETDMVFGVLNPEDTLEKEPRLIKRTCLAIAGTEWDLTDECIRDCSRWDPRQTDELIQLASRRLAYQQRHPELPVPESTKLLEAEVSKSVAEELATKILKATIDPAPEHPEGGTP